MNKAPSTSGRDQQRDDAVAGGALGGGAAVSSGSAQSGGCSEQTYPALPRTASPTEGPSPPRILRRIL